MKRENAKFNFFNFILILLTAIQFSACSGDSTVYEKYHVFNDKSWNRFDYLDYEVPLNDPDAEYDVFVDIRHEPDIPYKEILISLTIYSPSGSMRSANHTLDLVDRQGKPLSQCSGDICNIVIPVRSHLTINEAGIVKFEIENKYTKIEMPGIVQVGLIVKKSK